jgi:hypothetical protein
MARFQRKKMSTSQTMFTPNGDGYDISPAGILLLAAGTVFGPPHETTAEGVRKARALIDDMLAAARAGGFKQSDILLTLLARNQPTKGCAAMAQAACDAAGTDALLGAFDRARMA